MIRRRGATAPASRPRGCSAACWHSAPRSRACRGVAPSRGMARRRGRGVARAALGVALAFVAATHCAADPSKEPKSVSVTLRTRWEVRRPRSLAASAVRSRAAVRVASRTRLLPLLHPRAVHAAGARGCRVLERRGPGRLLGLRGRLARCAAPPLGLPPPSEPLHRRTAPRLPDRAHVPSNCAARTQEPRKQTTRFRFSHAVLAPLRR